MAQLFSVESCNVILVSVKTTEQLILSFAHIPKPKNTRNQSKVLLIRSKKLCYHQNLANSTKSGLKITSVDGICRRLAHCLKIRFRYAKY